MGTAYNPGLKVTEYMVFSKERRLPMKGEVLVQVGEKVTSETIVARTFLEGKPELINVANRLNILPRDIRHCILKREGEPLAKDEIFARASSFFGLFKTLLTAPCAGTLETISEVTGQVVIRQSPIPVQIKAYIDGTVADVLPEEGAIIRTPATFIQGIFGIGGEVVGPLQIVVDSPTEPIKASHILPEHRGKILAGGSLVTSEAMHQAVAVGALGIVSGGINDKDLKDFLGYDLGVAITGTEDKGVTLVITEGFGEIRMADRTFHLLQSRQGQKTSINGATQIRAGVIRPEVVIPHLAARPSKDEKTGTLGLVMGCPVRVIRNPHFGRLAQVVSLPVQLQTMESESKVRVVEIQFADGEKFLLPRANVEIIEE